MFRNTTAGDPKFWPAWIRYTILANLCVYVWLGNAYSAGISTGFLDLLQEFHVDFTALSHLISWSVLTLGISNLLWAPLAVCVGKRPVMLVSTAMFLGGSIWSWKATSYNSLLGARIFTSIGGGSIESLGPAIIADLFFEKYFATAMALFAFFLSAGSQIGPLAAGYIIQDRGWRWFFIVITIITAINLAGMVFFLPETNFRRVFYEGETAAEADKDAREVAVHMEEKIAVTHVPTNNQDDGVDRPHYAGNYWKDLVSFRDRGIERRGLLAFPKQFSLPFRFILVPGALFAACSYGVLLGGIVLISTISPSILIFPPYLFTSVGLGLSSLGSFAGVIVAYPIAGPLTDLMSSMLGKRNGGVHKPEHRIPALIIAFLVSPPGLILFAYMIAEQRSFYIASVGYAMQSAGLVLIPSVVISYVVDAYPETGAEALVLINAGKNLVAFGISWIGNEWYAKQGLKDMFLELAGAQWGVLLFAIPLYFFGPALRRVTNRLL